MPGNARQFIANGAVAAVEVGWCVSVCISRQRPDLALDGG
jgi:hypothetical protein